MIPNQETHLNNAHVLNYSQSLSKYLYFKPVNCNKS